MSIFLLLTRKFLHETTNNRKKWLKNHPRFSRGFGRGGREVAVVTEEVEAATEVVAVAVVVAVVAVAEVGKTRTWTPCTKLGRLVQAVRFIFVYIERRHEEVKNERGMDALRSGHYGGMFWWHFYVDVRVATWSSRAISAQVFSFILRFRTQTRGLLRKREDFRNVSRFHRCEDLTLTKTLYSYSTIIKQGKIKSLEQIYLHSIRSKSTGIVDYLSAPTWWTKP